VQFSSESWLRAWRIDAQANPSNRGRVLVGVADMDSSTLSGVLAHLAVDAGPGSEWSVESQDNRNRLRPADYWLDAEVSAVAATGTLTSDATAPDDAESVTIGTVTYVFKTALSTGPAVPYEVLIGGSAAVTLDNLKAAINAGAGAGTLYGTGTAAHPDVTATANADTTQEVEAIVPGVSTLATTTTSAHLSWGAGTLTGGIDGDSALITVWTS